MVSPVNADSFNPVSDGATACDHLKELANTRAKVKLLVDWLLDDNDDFDLTLIEDFLLDAAKKGWFVQTNASTGKLELIEKIPLDGLDDGDAEEGDILQWDGNNWVPGSLFSATDYQDPDGGSATVPTANAGGLFSKTHGITASGLPAAPRLFRVYIVNIGADCGYSVGDIVDAQGLIALETSGGNESTQAVQISADTIAVNVVFRNCIAGTYRIFNKATGVVGTLDPTKWLIKFFYPF